MNRSLLHHLPDIAAFAHRHARDLMTQLEDAHTEAADWPNSARVHLLRGDTLSAMLGLLGGRGSQAPLRAGIPLVWLAQTLPPAVESAASPLGFVLHRARALAELTVNLFVARELLAQQGALVIPIDTDPEQCITRLMNTVFGHVRSLTHPRSREHVYITGPGAAEMEIRHTSPNLWNDLAHTFTRPRQPVLVAPADPDWAACAAGLDRRWILVQPDAMDFALLREYLIAHRVEQDGARWCVHETARCWTVPS